jgi:hypothetical protein
MRALWKGERVGDAEIGTWPQFARSTQAFSPPSLAKLTRDNWFGINLSQAPCSTNTGIP